MASFGIQVEAELEPEHEPYHLRHSKLVRFQAQLSDHRISLSGEILGGLHVPV
jgi:hypothetical protein